MFTNLTNGKRNKAAQIAMSALALSVLTSCHFGDIEDVRPKDYADEERQFSITLDATTPSGDVSRATRTNITDLFTDGLEVVWNAGDQIAMFGKENQIRDEKAVMLTAGGGSNPHLDKNWEAHNTVDEDDYISWANFTGEAKLVVANTTYDSKGNPVWNENDSRNSYNFSFVYPYARFADEQATASEVTLDFTGQSGKLAPTDETDKSKTIATDYEYAWGYGRGIATGHVSFGNLSFVDAMGTKCNDIDAHLQHVYQDGGLVLDNKMSIIRFALVYQKEGQTNPILFNKYLEGTGCQITKITLRDSLNNLYPTAILNLESGAVTSDTPGNIEIDDYQGIALTDILPDDNKNLGSELSWGSAFYLAIPVPSANMPMNCTLEIKVEGTNENIAGLYYANFETREFNEGRYYMTAPIPCTKKEQASIDNKIRIYLYYKASLVYDINDIEGGDLVSKETILWEGSQKISGWTGINLTDENRTKLANIQVGDVLKVEVDNEYSNGFWVAILVINNWSAVKSHEEQRNEGPGHKVVEITIDDSWKNAFATYKNIHLNANPDRITLRKISIVPGSN